MMALLVVRWVEKWGQIDQSQGLEDLSQVTININMLSNTSSHGNIHLICSTNIVDYISESDNDFDIMMKKNFFEALYRKFNRRELIHPDPLEFLYRYSSAADREIVGLLASSLAYGRVQQILKSVERVLDIMGPSPFAYLMYTTDSKIEESLQDFKHRFNTGKDIAHLLISAKHLIMEYGSLNRCFLAGYSEDDETIIPALISFAQKLDIGDNYLIPTPQRGSACKRLNLFLRWMVRCDEVDPGGWCGIPSSKLIVPIDTHMHKIAKELGLTKRSSADSKTALEITEGFRMISPDDPARYDFVLTRFGIRNDMPPIDFSNEQHHKSKTTKTNTLMTKKRKEKQLWV